MPKCFDILNKDEPRQRNELVCDVERRKGRRMGEGDRWGGEKAQGKEGGGRDRRRGKRVQYRCYSGSIA